VLNQEQIELFKCGLEPLAAEQSSRLKDTEDITNIDAMVNFDHVFKDCIIIPQILDANRFLMGSEIKYECCHAMIKTPHPKRKTNCDEFRPPEKMKWHRGLRPKWETFPHGQG